MYLLIPAGSVGKESACNAEDSLQCRRSEFDPWVRKSPWEGKAPYFSILAWELSGTEEPGRLQSMGLQELDTT